MPAFKIVLAYDGTDLVGWQRQASGTSVQGVLEEALQELDGRPVIVHGAGRTDAGVHALGQVASFTVERAIAANALRQAINARLPDSIRILDCGEVDPEFHVRFSARAKTYRYRIWNADAGNPFERAYAWHVMGALDVDAMCVAARTLEGRHDFAAFQASGGFATTTEREVIRSRISILSDAVDSGLEAAWMGQSSRAARGYGSAHRMIVLDIAGSGFLRHMVRVIVGSLVEIGRGRRDARWLTELLESGDRELAGPTAPARGLFLVGVDYDSGALADKP